MELKMKVKVYEDKKTQHESWTTIWYQRGGKFNFTWHPVKLQKCYLEETIERIEKMGYPVKHSEYKPCEFVDYFFRG